MKLQMPAVLRGMAIVLMVAFCGCGTTVPDEELPPPGIQTTHLETYRPQFHYTPESGWMNDPNGLVRVGDTWNLYHQYIPGEFVIDQMNWGHATSTDLVHWEYRPVALQTNPDLGMAYSGSAIVDDGNMSGLCGDDPARCVLAFFTHSLMLGGDQKQSLAASVDGGMTFAEYEGNPLMPNPGQTHFRDPKVFSYDESLDNTATAAPAPSQARPVPPYDGPLPRKWVMALAQGKQVGLYTSGNLLEWQPLSTMDNAETWAGGVWECPDLVRMEIEDEPGAYAWVMIVGVFDGAPWTGSGVQYITGDFDGYVFTPDRDLAEPRWLDHGWDFYAAQSFSNVPDSDGRHIVMAWMNNWRYAFGIPAMPWQGAMTFPRQLSMIRLADGSLALRQEPVDEIATLRRGVVVDLDGPALERLSYMDSTPSDYLFRHLYSSDTGLYEIEVTGPRDVDWNIQVATAEIPALTDEDSATQVDRAAGIAPGHNASVNIGVDDGQLFIDRGSAICDGCPSSMGRHYSADLPAPDDLAAAGLPTDRTTLMILVDHSSVEVFADGGRTTMTALVFLPGPRWDISVEAWDATLANDPVLDRVTIREMFSAWTDR